MTTGEKIQKIRKKSGLTQEELAKRIGIKRGTLAQYESGKRSPKRETLERFAKALNVSWYELAHTDDSSWDWIVKAANDTTSNNAPDAQWYERALKIVNETEREDALNSFDEMKQARSQLTLKDQQLINQFVDFAMGLTDTCMKTENKTANEAIGRVAPLLECLLVCQNLNEHGERVAYCEGLQLLEPDLELSGLIFRIWKKRPEKMLELLDMLKRLAQTQDYSKHNSQCVTEDTEDTAGDTPKDTPPKND